MTLTLDLPDDVRKRLATRRRPQVLISDVCSACPQGKPSHAAGGDLNRFVMRSRRRE